MSLHHYRQLYFNKESLNLVITGLVVEQLSPFTPDYLNKLATDTDETRQVSPIQYHQYSNLLLRNII